MGLPFVVPLYDASSLRVRSMPATPRRADPLLLSLLLGEEIEPVRDRRRDEAAGIMNVKVSMVSRMETRPMVDVGSESCGSLSHEKIRSLKTRYASESQ